MRKRWLLWVVTFLCVITALMAGGHPVSGNVNSDETLIELLFPRVDVLIDAGHGGIDSGTYYRELYEKQLNLAMGRILYRELTNRGYHVILNRVDDYALSDDNRWLRNASRHKRDLAQRSQLARELSPRIVLSLHVNWSSSSSRRGPLVLYQKNYQSFLLAELLQIELNHLYKSHELPQPGKTYYVLNHIPSPTVIIEMGFISNPVDREQLTTPAGREKIAQAISRAVEKYFSVMARWD